MQRSDLDRAAAFAGRRSITADSHEAKKTTSRTSGKNLRYALGHW